MTTILAQGTTIEWVAGVSATVLAGLVLSAIIAVFAHITNSDRHTPKTDMVSNEVFKAVMESQKEIFKIHQQNMEKVVIELKKTIAQNFETLFENIEKLRN